MRGKPHRSVQSKYSPSRAWKLKYEAQLPSGGDTGPAVQELIAKTNDSVLCYGR